MLRYSFCNLLPASCTFHWLSTITLEVPVPFIFHSTSHLQSSSLLQCHLQCPLLYPFPDAPTITSCLRRPPLLQTRPSGGAGRHYHHQATFTVSCFIVVILISLQLQVDVLLTIYVRDIASLFTLQNFLSLSFMNC